jgi:NAD(P)-dependent dehydrogenase (short-subunit alcohol dehydrogenase family)
MTAPRVVVITGASSGIGRATAHAASASGDHVVLAARGQAPLDDTALECKTEGAESVLVVPTDVGDDEAVLDLFEDVVDTYGRVDVVIHCAGVVAYGRTEEIPADVFEKVLQTNVVGSVNVSRHAVSQMRLQEHGSIVLVGSVIGHVAVPSMSPYVLSKHSVRVLARQLRIENRDTPGLTIAYVAPGGVDTPIYEQAGTYSGFHGKPPPPVASPERIARILLRRVGSQRGRAQTSIANDVMRFGFNTVPWLFDALVGPLFRAAAIDRTRPVDATPGNVLTSSPDGHGLRGEPGNVLVGIGRNLVEHVRSMRPDGGNHD